MYVHLLYKDLELDLQVLLAFEKLDARRQSRFHIKEAARPHVVWVQDTSFRDNEHGPSRLAAPVESKSLCCQLKAKVCVVS